MKKKIIIELTTKRKEMDGETVEILDECFGGIDGGDIKIPDEDISDLEYNHAVKRLLEYIFNDEDDDGLDVLYGDIEGGNYTELMCEGELDIKNDGEVIISYNEGSDSGLENTNVKIFFNKNEPTLVSMIREGDMNTMLSFEAGKRHKSIYNTPYMPFDLTVNTIEVENDIMSMGTLYLNYIMEVSGLCRDRITLNIRLREF